MKKEPYGPSSNISREELPLTAQGLSVRETDCVGWETIPHHYSFNNWLVHYPYNMVKQLLQSA